MAARKRRRSANCCESRENPTTEIDTGDLVIGSLLLVAFTAIVVWPGYQIRRLHQLQAQNAFRAGAVAGAQAVQPVPVTTLSPPTA